MSGWAERVCWRFRKRDKGSIILECVVSLGLLALLTLGYTRTSVEATVTQRTAVNHSIATQAVQAELEAARATSWAKLGNAETFADDDPAVTLLNTHPDGPFDSLVHGVAGGIRTTETTESRGLTMTLRTIVGWASPTPPGKSEPNVYDYGTKIVIVEASWEDVAGKPETISQSVLVTPGIGESVPDGIRGAS